MTKRAVAVVVLGASVAVASPRCAPAQTAAPVPAPVPVSVAAGGIAIGTQSSGPGHVVLVGVRTVVSAAEMLADRYVYRPGDVVHVFVAYRSDGSIARPFTADLELDAPGSRTPLSAAPKTPVDAYGTNAYRLTIPADVAPGAYELRTAYATAPIVVAERGRAEARFDLEMPAAVARPGRLVHARARLRAADGSPLAGVRLEYDVAAGPIVAGSPFASRTSPISGAVVTDGSGIAEIDVPVGSESLGMRLTVRATVRDPRLREVAREAHVDVGSGTVVLVVPARTYVAEGAPIVVRGRLDGPKDEVAGVPVTVRSLAGSTSPRFPAGLGAPTSAPAPAVTTVTTADGQFAATFPAVTATAAPEASYAVSSGGAELGDVSVGIGDDPSSAFCERIAHAGTMSAPGTAYRTLPAPLVPFSDPVGLRVARAAGAVTLSVDVRDAAGAASPARVAAALDDVADVTARAFGQRGAEQRGGAIAPASSLCASYLAAHPAVAPAAARMPPAAPGFAPQPAVTAAPDVLPAVVARAPHFIVTTAAAPVVLADPAPGKEVSLEVVIVAADGALERRTIRIHPDGSSDVERPDDAG